MKTFKITFKNFKKQRNKDLMEKVKFNLCKNQKKERILFLKILL